MSDKPCPKSSWALKAQPSRPGQAHCQGLERVGGGNGHDDAIVTMTARVMAMKTVIAMVVVIGFIWYHMKGQRAEVEMVLMNERKSEVDVMLMKERKSELEVMVMKG